MSTNFNGITIPGPADPIPGIPPNASVMSAMSSGQLRRNVQLTGWGVSPGVSLAAGTHPNPTLAALASDAGQHGTHPLVTANGGSPTVQACGGSGPGPVHTVPSIGGAGPGTILTVPDSMLASSLTFATPPTYGG
jgi:hypothetical protein